MADPKESKIKNFFSAVAKEIKGIIPQDVKDLVKKESKGLTPSALKEDLSRGATKAKEDLKEVKDVIASKVQQARDGLDTDKLKQEFSGLKPSSLKQDLSKGAQKAREDLAAVKDEVAGALKSAKSAASEKLSETASALRQEMKNIKKSGNLEKLKQDFSGLKPSSLKKDLSKGATKAKEDLKEVKDTVVSKIQQVSLDTGELKREFSGLKPSSLKQDLSKGVDKAKEDLKAVKDGVSGAISSAKSAVAGKLEQTAQDFKQDAKNVKNSLKHTGSLKSLKNDIAGLSPKAIKNDIKKGIKNSTKGFLDKLNGLKFSSEKLDKMENKLGLGGPLRPTATPKVNSPSKGKGGGMSGP